MATGAAGAAAAAANSGLDANQRGSNMQYLSKHMKSGFGSSSTKDKSSLLYHDLKKKLSYDSGPQGTAADISAGLKRKDNLLGLTSQASGKATMRPTSVNHSTAVGGTNTNSSA